MISLPQNLNIFLRFIINHQVRLPITQQTSDLRTPFGGVKASGIGREGGFEALRFFTEAKNVCIKY